MTRSVASLAAVALLLQACGAGEGASEKPSVVSATSAPDTTATQADDSKRVRSLALAPSSTWLPVPVVNDALLQNLSIPADAPTRGMWSGTKPWPLNAIHSIVLSDGRLLTFGTPFNTPATQDGRFYDLWNPEAGFVDAAHLRSQVADPVNSFCGTSAWLADGRLLVSGGNGAGGKSSGLYSPTSVTAAADGARLAAERWYATMMTLADGRALILGGTVPYQSPITSQTPEVYEAGQWRSLFGASSTPIFGVRRLGNQAEANPWYYPRAWVAPDGSVFGITSNIMFRLRPDDNNRSGSITQIGSFKTVQDSSGGTTPNVGFTSTAVMFEPGRILQVGGNGITDNNPNNASQQATIIDINGANPVITETAPMSFRRHWANATVLPGGQVVVTGGTSIGWDPANAMRAAEIWNPATGTWTVGPSNAETRTYHSSALLLPNGAVFTAGGGAPGTVNNLNADLYYPPQLFRSVNGVAQLAPRPVLQAISSRKAAHGDSLGLLMATNAPLSQVSLVALGSVTHSFNNSQRRIPLSFTQSGSEIAANLPASANIAPPGYYMVFAIDAAGVPSRGTIIALGNVAAPSDARTTPGLPAGAVACATEGGVCTIPAGRKATVYFGANTTYASRGGLTDGVACTNAFFGDPVPGTVKSCAYVLDAVDAPPLVDAPPALSGTTVSYAPQSTPGASYSWNFGDGTPATDFSGSANTTHAFATAGVYSVTLSMRSASGAITSRSFLQAVAAASTSVQPMSSSALALETRAAASTRVWVANPDQNSVGVIDSANNTRVAEIAVGAQPVGVATAPGGRVWVVNKEAATISVINAATLTVERTLSLPPGTRPHGLVFAADGSAAYVALEAGGLVQKLNVSSGAVIGSVDVGRNVRHLSISGDGTRLLASRFTTPPLPGEGTASVDTRTAGGEVVVINAGPLTIDRTVVLRHSDKIDTEAQGSGVPNYLGAAVIAPDGASAWVPSKQDNIKRGILRNGQNLDFQNTVRAISSRIALDTLSEDYPRRVDHDNASVASAAAFHPSGAYLFVALETSRQLAVMDASGARELFRVDVGLAPQAVVVDRAQSRIYVQNFMERSVTVLDMGPLTRQGRPALPVLAQVVSVQTERLAAAALRGKQLFYDARDPRLARDNYMSCASCHNDGGHDGRVWDLTGFGEGLRNTIDLRGHGGLRQGFLHWSANFDEVQDFEGQIRALAGGTGLMTDAQFNTGTRNTPLGDRKTGVSADLDALAAYVDSLDTLPASPNRNADGSLTTAATAGRTVFDRASCASCHGGAAFTSSLDATTLRNVGTIRPTSGKRLGGALNGIDPPTLRGLNATGPYLHDGSAFTLAAAVAAHTGAGVTAVSASDMPNLVAYLLALDGRDTPPARQVTEGVARLVARHSGKVLDINAASLSDGGVAQQWGWSGAGNQLWRITSAGNGEYTLTAQHSGKLLEVTGCGATDGARIQQWAVRGTPCQRWRIEPLPDGVNWRLLNVNSGKALDVGAAGLNDGAPVQQWTWQNGPNQQWRIETVTGAPVNQPPTVTLTAPAGGATPTAGRALVLSASATDSDGAVSRVEFYAGATLIATVGNAPYTASWTPAAAGAVSLTARAIDNLGAAATSAVVGVTIQAPAVRQIVDGTYRLVAQHSGKVLDVNAASVADGATVLQWDWSGGANQRWRITSVGNGEYTLAAQHSGKLLEPAGCGANDGARVQQWAVRNAACQRWRIEPLPDGVTWRLVNANSGKVLDVDNSSLALGGVVQQWTWGNGANQRWRIEVP